MKYPIINDPIALVAEAFETEFPDVNYRAYYGDAGDEAWGVTTFPDDGSEPEIIIDRIIFEREYGLSHAAEIFAHELAHCVAGLDEDHGVAWEAAFEKIHAKYETICNERFGDRTSADK